MAQSTADSVRIDGIPRPGRRLRRIVVPALLCALLAIVFSIGWYFFRPLTAVEQRLVGTWRTTGTAAVFTFHSDRTLTSPRDPPGRWSVHEHRLYTRDAFVIEVVRTLFRNRVDDSMELTFQDDDNISLSTLNGGTQKWQRVSPQ